MKTRESILQEINQIENRHRNDKDGGYSFIDYVERFFKVLSTKEKKILIDVLIEIVDKEDANLWGVALESMVRFQDENVGKYLFQLTKNKKRNCELLDQVFLTLVRLGYTDSSEEIVKHIENGLDSVVRKFLAIASYNLCTQSLKMRIPSFHTLWQCPSISLTSEKHFQPDETPHLI